MIRTAPVFVYALFAAASLGGTVSAKPQSSDNNPRVYVFDDGRVLALTRDGKAAITSINARIRTHQAALDEKASAIRGMQQKLDAGAGLTTPAALAQLRTDIAKQETALRRAQEDADRDLDDLRQRLLQPLEQRMLMVISIIAKERNADAIFNRPDSPILYASEAVDLTSEIAKRMDTPASQPPAGAPTEKAK